MVTPLRNERSVHWVSAIDPRNSPQLAALQARMLLFYQQNAAYYASIDYASEGWMSDAINLEIVRQLKSAGSILEIGCGSANILRSHPEFQCRYFGCDLSPALIAACTERYSQARFRTIENPQTLPFADCSFDAVFSIFVIEHTVYPNLFLDECCRVLKPGGLFMLRCPDFLAQGSLPSQRAGYSAGTGRDKLVRGKWLDAWVTGFDRKIRLPWRCQTLRRLIGNAHAFYINLQPVCFTDSFIADYDAVYVTYAPEIVHYTEGRIRFFKSTIMRPTTTDIFLCGTKLNEVA